MKKKVLQEYSLLYRNIFKSFIEKQTKIKITLKEFVKNIAS